MTTKTLLLLTILLALPILSTDIYLPSLQVIQQHFQNDYAEVQLTLTIYFLTFGLVQLVYGSLSDCFGRKPMTIISLTIYLIGSLVCLKSGTIDGLIWGRCLQALGAGCAILVFAMIRDRHEGPQVARLISYMSSVVAMSPIIAPIIGGYIQTIFSWQANFVILAIISGLLLGLSILILPETNPAKRSAQSIFIQLMADYRSLIINKQYMSNALVAACAFGALFSFISGSPYLFLEKLSYSPELFSWTFAIAAIGYVLGAFIIGKLTSTLGIDKLMSLGLSCLVGGAMVITTLCSFYGLSLYTIILPQLICELGISIAVPVAITRAPAPFPTCAGSGSALIGSLRFFSAMLSRFLTMLFKDDLSLALTISGFAICALMIRNQKEDGFLSSFKVFNIR